LEVVDELKDYLEDDIENVQPSKGEDDPKTLYPSFSKELKTKSNEFKQENDYRRICCVESFMLGLVLISRARRHFTHAPWFRISALSAMIDVHGGVRLKARCSGQANKKDSLLQN
jgi:hypothetical protein